MKAWLGRTWNRFIWPFSSSEKRLRIVMDYASRDPQVKSLIDQARADGVSFNLLPVLGDSVAGYYMFDSDKGQQSIFLSTHSLFDIIPRPIASVASTLVHELRHYWQYKKLGLTVDTAAVVLKKPRLAFVFNRVIEADAFSFEVGFRRGLAEGNIHDDAARKKRMKKHFKMLLSTTGLSSLYDIDEVRRLERWHLSGGGASYFEKVKGLDIDLAAIQNLVSDYIDPMPEQKFERIVLDKSQKDVIAVVDLIDEFSRAAAREKTPELSEQIKARVAGLKNNKGFF